MYPVITISRELGSGGHRIAIAVSEKLNIPMIDKEFIQKAAGKTGLSEKEIRKSEEAGSYFEKYLNSSFYNGLYLGDNQDKIYEAQKQIILEYAKNGPCVIVGRCADYILEKEGIHSLNVFVHADMAVRKQKYIEVYGPQKQSVEKLLAKNDKGKRFYYHFYTDGEWGAYENYHMSLDSGFLGEDYCVELIVNTAKKFSKGNL